MELYPAQTCSIYSKAMHQSYFDHFPTNDSEVIQHLSCALAVVNLMVFDAFHRVEEHQPNSDFIKAYKEVMVNQYSRFNELAQRIGAISKEAFKQEFFNKKHN